MWGATIKFTIKEGLETEFESKAKIFLEQAKVNAAQALIDYLEGHRG